jgi:hypothetical protein
MVSVKQFYCLDPRTWFRHVVVFVTLRLCSRYALSEVYSFNATFESWFYFRNVAFSSKTQTLPTINVQ